MLCTKTNAFVIRKKINTSVMYSFESEIKNETVFNKPKISLKKTRIVCAPELYCVQFAESAKR